MSEVAISVENLSKTFRLPYERHSSVKSNLVNFYRRRKGYELQEALKNVSFEVNRGDFFGIVGRNGSGKSTLLKLLAGIYNPTNGTININGKLTPFIELGVGFNMELTGRENVFLNGALLGFNRKDMNKMYNDIVEFAELERFMDQKLKNYSSGMQVRLAFSIAIRAQSEILLLDEVLAVGDANFQKKCFDVFKRIKEEGRTVVLVTHDMATVQNYCTGAMLINNGQIITKGNTLAVTKQYNDLNVEEMDKKTHTKRKRSTNSKVSITDYWISKNNKRTTSLTPENKIDFFIKYKANEDIENPIVGITLKDQLGRSVYAINTKAEDIYTGKQKKGESYIVKFEIDNIYSDGNYYLIPAITDYDGGQVLDVVDEGLLFNISGWDFPAFLTQPKHKIGIEKANE